MKHLKIVLILMSMIFLLPSAYADGAWSMDLVAGQNTIIGKITFMINGGALSARYQITEDGWCMSATHLYVDNVAPEHHAPGRFTYTHQDLDCVTEDIYNVSTPVGDVFVSAHADTHYAPTDSSEDSTDDLFTGTSTLVASSGTNSYLTAQVSGAIDGTYPAWCVDLDNLIYTGLTYTSYSHDSTDGADGLVDYSENIDLINYILNQDYVSQGYSVLAVQSAIWALIDDTTSPYGFIIGTDVIVNDARANGEGFVPGCGDVMGIILEPIEDNAQHLIIEYPVPCSQDTSDDDQPRSETAWALADWGIAFDQGWGMYFQLVSTDNESTPAEENNDTASSDAPGNSGSAPQANNNSNHENPPAVEQGQGNPEPPRNRNAEAPGQNRDQNTPPGNRSADAPGQNGQGKGNR